MGYGGVILISTEKRQKLIRRARQSKPRRFLTSPPIQVVLPVLLVFFSLNCAKSLVTNEEN